MERTTLRGQLRSDNSRPEKWMCESHLLAIELDDVRGPGVGQAGDQLLPDHGLEKRHRRMSQGRNNAHGLERVGAEALEALLQKPLDRRRKRELLSQGERAAPTHKRSGELEGEERVAT